VHYLSIDTPMEQPMPSTPIFAVRLNAALRVKPFTSKEETRYYISGVHISASAAGGAVCAATDGHRLGVRHDPQGLCLQEAIVRIPNEIKAPPKLVACPWLVGVSTGNGNGHISVVEARGPADEDTAEAAMQRVEDCVLRIGRAFIDGTFPDWRRVIPAPSEKDAVRAFNGDYVKGFGKYMTLRGTGEGAPHLIQIDAEPEFIGVLMPMRPSDHLAKGLPDWVAHPSPPAKQKKAA
jgi:hypothetical protein